jgi:integrase/recombinase XerD
VSYLVANQIALSCAPEGPLAVYLGPFAESLRREGYSQGSIRRKLMLAACFSRWLEQNEVALRCITSGHLTRFLRCRARDCQVIRGDRASLDQFLNFLRRESVIPAETALADKPTPADCCVQQYEQYLRDARGLADVTIHNYAPYVRDLLKHRFDDGPIALWRLCARDIVGFVQRRAPRMHTRSTKLMTTALRSFLQYARYCGSVKLDLATAVPVVANWSMPSIPRAIAPPQIRQLLASIDRRTPMGLRDYAIMLLLARLGLRSGEATFLELDDIHWNAGRLSIRGKSGQRSDLPLPADVGKAIAAYLQRGRPRSTSRRVFLRVQAPLCGLGPDGIGSIVRARLKRTGIEAPTYGAHQFRHGLATEMLRRGASLGEIGELLGHRSPESTKIYAKVDLNALRSIALPWPGGVR